MDVRENGSNGAETADNGHDARGRFKKGAKPGPGRPPKRAAAELLQSVALLDDGNDLVLRAMELRQSLDAWRHIVGRYPADLVAELVAQSTAARRHIPAFVLEAPGVAAAIAARGRPVDGSAAIAPGDVEA